LEVDLFPRIEDNTFMNANIQPIVAFARKYFDTKLSQVEVVNVYFKREIWSLEKVEWQRMTQSQKDAFAARVFAAALRPYSRPW
jgi:hypothetical protein